MREGFAALVLITLLFSIPSAGAVTQLVITQPSDSETLFAEMRDFYVYGIFSPTAANPGDFRIELYPESACSGDICTGLPTRDIQSHVDPVSGVTNASQIDWSFVDGATVKGGYVPDIIKEPGGYTNPNNKVVVTYSYYGGLIPGGVTQGYNTSYQNSTGSKLQNLTAGNYRIKVTGLSGDFAARCVTKAISFGTTDTALGTNRPTSNRNVRISYATSHGLRTYFDSFPGYFSDGGSNWSNFRTLAAPNNGIEIVNDLYGTTTDTVAVSNNTMFVYNINSASTTYSVELAPILKYGLAEGENTTFLYYGNGEPVLTYTDSGGAPRHVTSALKQFSRSNRIALTRVEVRNPAGSSYENLYDPNDTVSKTVYTDLSGTISLNQGQYFTVYGVTKPIASTVQTTSTPYWYTIDNRITNISCTITDTRGTIVSASSHEVNLSRYYNNYPGSSNPHQKFNSLFEFGSDITTLTTPGIYTVSLTGRDVTGSAVSGATTSFSLKVNDASQSETSNGDPPGSPSNAPQVLISPGASKGEPVTFTFTFGSPEKTSVESVTLIPAGTLGQTQCILLSATPGTALQLNDRAVAGYYSIAVNWINPDAIDHAEITFVVDKEWLDAHRVAPSQVVMLRYTNNQWVELPTKPYGNHDTTYGYIATTPAFSYFAVAEKMNSSFVTTGTPAPTVPEAAGTDSTSNATVNTFATGSASSAVRTVVPTTVQTVPVPAVTPAQSSILRIFFPSEGLPLETVIAWTIVFLVLIVVIWLIRRWWIRRQNPSLFQNF
ncbi:MAG: PGF-pre-PGF domain-containing protein [Methanoregula sp.]|nr:PGF-pre-PGF domain-containing protein [Methanoregula sp.]